MIQEIKDRWNAETPIFFVKVRKLALSVGTSATAVWLANQSMSLQLPDLLLTICKYSIAVCATMGLTAQLTKQ